MTCGEKLPVLPNAIAIGDAHAHFFNASDLPIYGFIRYVAGKGVGSDNPFVLGAAITLQTLANIIPPSANAEQKKLDKHLLSRKPSSLNVTQAEFATDFKTQLKKLAIKAIDKISKGSKSIKNSDLLFAGFDIKYATQADDDLSVLWLADYLSIDNGDDSGIKLFDDSSSEVLDIDVFKRGLEIDENKVVSILNNEPITEDKYFQAGFSFEIIYTYMRWGYLLMQKRCALVGEYLNKIRTQGTTEVRAIQPKVMINLMVDYDYWISKDAKQPRSNHISQIDFWDSYSRSVISQVDIHTFTGFDPLKLAVEKRLGVAETHFDRLKALYKTAPNGRPSFSGFKFYPPMGFRPWNNSELNDSDFRGTNGVGSRIIDLWKSEWNGAGMPLGKALDDALADAYDFCLENDIPILAHASPSVLTADNFVNRPNPGHWINLIESKARSKSGYKYSKLRLNLGHFTVAQKFINHNHQWSREHIKKLFAISAASEANVYADIGMMDEFVVAYENGNPGLTYEFFDSLAEFCESVDPDCKRLMFGTDWIMLGHVPGHKNYLKVIVEALDKNSWWSENNRKENFLHLNFRRFLKLEPS